MESLTKGLVELDRQAEFLWAAGIQRGPVILDGRQLAEASGGPNDRGLRLSGNGQGRVAPG